MDEDEVRSFVAQLAARIAAAGFRQVRQSVDSEGNTRVSLAAAGGSVLLFVFDELDEVASVSAYLCPDLSDASLHLCSWRRPSDLVGPCRELVEACWESLVDQDVQNGGAGRPTWTGGLRKLPFPLVHLEATTT